MARFFLWISRYLLAFTFIFSGFVKAVDPLGSAYKFFDYFMAFGLGFLEPLALPFAFLMCAAEILIGLLLLFRVQHLIAIWGVFLFMLLFTPLTLYLAIFNPVSDCGCFGDAIMLSNWGTFFKNIPLFAASTYLLMNRKKIWPVYSSVHSMVIASILLVVSFMPSIHGYNRLPLMDFRPFSVGVNIQEAMQFPEDAEMDEYKTYLYYEKGGKVKKFTQDNYPWQDSTWTFVDSKSVIATKGYTPPIDDFTLTNIDGDYVTDSILNFDGYYLLPISTRLSKIKRGTISKLNELYFKAQQEGVGFALVTASPQSEIDAFIGEYGVAFPFLMADDIMLKTVIRSNPGLVLLHHGTIIEKWHHKKIPSASFLEGDILSNVMIDQDSSRTKLWSYTLVILVVLGLILVSPLSISRKEQL